MKWILRHLTRRIKYFNLEKLFGKKLTTALAVIDRQGSIELDQDFSGVELMLLADF